MSVDAVRERFARFARDEAPGRSEVYLDWAQEVATGPAAEVIATLPEQRRQPPLVFAVTRQLGCGLVSGPDWTRFVMREADAVRAETARRSLQTNEPLRCAALLPALSLIPGPLALIELGASGGLCLYPDRYSYSYAHDSGVVTVGTGTPMLHSELRGGRLPALRVPEVVWRAGIDLAPIDVTDAEEAAWLRRLVWPGETGREERIAAAIAVAAVDPPVLFAGDAQEMLDAAMAAAPADATVVVTTPGVLPFLPWPARDALVRRLRADPVRWITLDAPGLHQGWTPGSVLPDAGFALALDGDVLGAADPLGGWVRWTSDV